MRDKKNKGNKQTFFNPVYSTGLATSRDVWCYNFSNKKLQKNIQSTIDFYNNLLKFTHEKPKLDSTKISWSRGFQNDYKGKRKKPFTVSAITKALYRPSVNNTSIFPRN